MKKEMVKKEASVAELEMPVGGWDDGDIEAKDLLIPMVCIAQGTSDVVKLHGIAKPGEIYETVGKKILGGKDIPLRFVPVRFHKTWVHCEMVNNRPEFRSTELYTPMNATKYQFDEVKSDGTMWRHYEVLNFFVLLEEDLKKGSAFPHLLTFRGTNKAKGKPLLNYMVAAREMKPSMPLCSGTFSAKTVIKTKDKDSWFVFEIKYEEKTPVDFMNKAIGWIETLKSSTVKIDESGHSDGEEKEAVVSSNVKKGEMSEGQRY